MLTGAIPGVNGFKNYACKSTRYASSAVLFKQVVTLEHSYIKLEKIKIYLKLILNKVIY